MITYVKIKLKRWEKQEEYKHKNDMHQIIRIYSDTEIQHQYCYYNL